MAEKTITGAARQVGITPSAMSHALRRLRQTFNDELMERTGHDMVPTQCARDLVKPVHAALQQLQAAVDQQLIWRVQDDANAGLRWLRGLIGEEFAALYEKWAEPIEGLWPENPSNQELNTAS